MGKIRVYHERTKHHPHRFARGPGRLDWVTQPDPFRRYAGTPLLPLAHVALGGEPLYEAAFSPGQIAPQPLTLSSISQLFHDSLAISAWKRAGDVTWALRINPSSGNLHPTEGYLLCGPVPGLSETPLVAHYAPREHGLEVRARVPAATWQALAAARPPGPGLPPGTVLVGLSSIHWREAWKYGERAFRYCQIDAGHAVAAVRLAAAGLGWSAVLLDDVGSDQIAQLLGLADPGRVASRATSPEAEPEEPECLLAVYPRGRAPGRLGLPEAAVGEFAALDWQGRPNQLSPRHVDWPIIEEAAAATEKPPTALFSPAPGKEQDAGTTVAEPAPDGPPLRQILHQRRSAVALDSQGSIDREAFYSIMSKVVAQPERPPFDALPWRPQVHLALFVHRVEGLAPGLYLLVRDAAHEPALRAALRASSRTEFAWEAPPGCPAGLALYRLAGGDTRAMARQLSCGQAIASDGCFSLGMIAAFEQPLEGFGAWFYRRLYWECGMIGQVLYLEAEAAGVRGTGIGCFFDDAVHELLGLRTTEYQSLYHFTVGHPVHDPRLTTLPAYPPADG